MDQTPLGLSILDAARIAGIGRTLLYGEIREGRLPVRKVGNRSLISRDDLVAWLANLPTAKPMPARANRK
jgi:excisionase family DNA binding protein